MRVYQTDDRYRWAAFDPQRRLSGEDATLQSVRGRCGWREQISPSDIGQQALPQALCFSQ